MKSSIPFVTLLVLLLFSSASGFQTDDGREKPPPKPAPTPRGPKGPAIQSTGPKVVVPQQRFASMTINAPIGCRVWINNVEVEMPESGILTQRSVKPGPHLIVARKQNFREYSQQVDVLLDHDNVFNVVLDPLSAKLTVSPSVGGAQVEVFNLETSQSLGRYFHHLNNVELMPGSYRITTSVTGYRTSVREITARPGESIYIEPSLEPLPTPSPTPTPTPPIRNIPMTLDVGKEDKYFLLRLEGSSGETAKTVGSINVSLGGPANNSVNGNLNGLPCRVEFVKLENIAEGSIVEAPGPGNNWSAIVVRVRPKDEKRRPISFAINWAALQNSPSIKTDVTPNVFIAAVAIQRVQPLFPPEAHGSSISGTVSVLVGIDSEGLVISAKAIDGPFMYRRVSEEAARKWKFRPATRDGRNVESQQTIQFKFER